MILGQYLSSLERAPPGLITAGVGARLVSGYAHGVARDVRAFLAELAEGAEASARAPRTYRYGSGPERDADLLMPAGGGPHRVAVLLHGGFWRARFTRATMAALAGGLADRGWATWNVEYRRAGSGGGVPETLEDVRTAIDALTSVEAPLDLPGSS